MEAKFKYIFDNETGILFKHYFGFIAIEDINSSWDYAIENKIIPKGTKAFVLDYRNATFNIPLEEHNKIAEYYRKNLDTFRNSKIAILTQNSKDVIIPTLVELKDNGYVSKPFYTEESAIRWVLS